MCEPRQLERAAGRDLEEELAREREDSRIRDELQRRREQERVAEAERRAYQEQLRAAEAERRAYTSYGAYSSYASPRTPTSHSGYVTIVCRSERTLCVLPRSIRRQYDGWQGWQGACTPSLGVQSYTLSSLAYHTYYAPETMIISRILCTSSPASSESFIKARY